MARPRAAAGLPRDQRAELEGYLRAHTLDETCTWLAGQPWGMPGGKLVIGRSALAELRRELLGAQSEDPGERVRRRVEEQARMSTTPAAAPVVDQGAQPPAPSGQDVDHLTVLRLQLQLARKISENPGEDSKTRLAAGKLVVDITAELRELEKEGRTESGPRVVFYFPEKVTIEIMEADE